MATTKDLLAEMYRRLEAAYGDQRWWPGETPFEVAVGAILTQNTSWANVEKAIANLKGAGFLEPAKLYGLAASEIAPLIKPAGYYNVKANRLRGFLEFLTGEYGGDLAAMARDGLSTARAKLLAVRGVGPETADSILLYACGLPTFVVDAYTHRVLYRHGLADEAATYDELKDLFEAHIEGDVAVYKQYHALVVRVGRERCRRGEPRCVGCPLEGFNAGE
jgi:endonuclease-3 related protein